MATTPDKTGTGYTHAERDRRWSAVRESAAKAGFDCVLVPLCVDGRNLHLSLEQSRGTRSDCRFLTQMDNAAVILPVDGRDPIVINESGEGNDWLQDARPVVRSWGETTAEALIESGFERARVGVSGLKRGKLTHGRAIAGVINYTAFAETLRRLPEAEFEDATDAVGYARYVKSEEQIAYLRQGAQIVAAGIEKMVELARPGIPEGVLYARVMRRMLELGGEYYPMALYTGPLGSGRLPRFENPPHHRFLEPMHLITNEVDAVCGGLIAQELQPIIVGAIPEAWKPVIELQRELYHAGLERMKPGVEFGELVDFTNGFGLKRGLKSLILMHGRGYGDDGPLFTPQDRGEQNRQIRIEKGNVFVWKPIAYSADERIQFSWGGCIVITDKGGQPLIERRPGMVYLEGGEAKLY